MATIRHGASAIAALYGATTPIYTVIIRRAFGVAGGAFAYPDDGADIRVAWLVLSFEFITEFKSDKGLLEIGVVYPWKEVSKQPINVNSMPLVLTKNGRI